MDTFRKNADAFVKWFALLFALIFAPAFVLYWIATGILYVTHRCNGYLRSLED